MADYSPTLPGPDAEPTQTPDQQTASGQPLGGQGSLLEALQSVGEGSGGGLAGGGGGIPQDAILSLLQGPSFGQRMGQALAGGAAAVRGIPNPANAIIEQQQRQQLGIAAMLQRMSEQDRLGKQWQATNARLNREENRRESHTLFEEQDKTAQRAKEGLLLQDTAYKNFIDAATDPDVKMQLAQQRAGIQKQLMGAEVPPNVLEGWVKPTPQTEERNKQIIAGFVTAAGDPEQTALVAKNFNLDPTAVQYYTANIKNPQFLAINNVPSLDVLHGQQVDREIKERDLLDKDTPRELKGDQKYAMSLRAMAEKRFPGREYASLSPPERSQVADAVHTQTLLEDEKKIRLQRDTALANQLTLLDARFQNQQAKPTPYPIIQKAVLPFQKGDELLTQLAQLKTQLKGIPDDALPAGDDWGSQRYAQLQRNMFYPNNQALVTFRQLWNPVMIGSLDRGYFDEKGPRSQQVFQKQLDVVDQLPSRKTMNFMMDTLNDLVQNKLLKDLDTASKTQGYPPEALDSARSLLAPYVPKNPLVQPPAPAPGLSQKGQFMDMRPSSKTYGKAIYLQWDLGDQIDPRLVPIK